MDLVQTRHFLTLARTLNFTRAAEICNISQSAFTRSIQRLEEQLGGSLILRERSLTQLTELGRTMLPLLQRTLEAAEAVRACVADHRRGQGVVPLRLGLAPCIAADRLHPILGEVAALIPGFELTLTRSTATSLSEELLRGDLHAAILPRPDPQADRIHVWPLWGEGMKLIAPVGHRLAALEQVDARALDGEVLISAEPAGLSNAVVEKLRSEFGVRLRRLHSATEREIPFLVSLGLGLALAIESQDVPPGVVARPVVHPDLTQQIVVGIVAGRPMNRAGAAFLRILRGRHAPGAELRPLELAA